MNFSFIKLKIKTFVECALNPYLKEFLTYLYLYMFKTGVILLNISRVSIYDLLEVFHISYIRTLYRFILFCIITYFVFCVCSLKTTECK